MCAQLETLWQLAVYNFRDSSLPQRTYPFLDFSQECIKYCFENCHLRLFKLFFCTPSPFLPFFERVYLLQISVDINTGTMEHHCYRWDNYKVLYSHFRGRTSKKKEKCILQVRVQTHWESSGRHSETFQDLLFSPLFWHLHIKLCGCWSNPLLCQSSCSALAWKHSETACFHFSRGKAGLCFKSPAPPDVP